MPLSLFNLGLSKKMSEPEDIIMQKKEGDTTITVPVPDHGELRIGTWRELSGSLAYLAHCLKRSDYRISSWEPDKRRRARVPADHAAPSS